MFSDYLEAVDLSATLCRACGTSLSASMLSALNPMDVLRSDMLPADNEVSDIRHAISAELISIRTYAEAISDLESRLERLRTQHGLLVANLRHKRSLLAPIRRLPPEVLAIILTFAFSAVFRHKPDSTRIWRHPILRVCRRWRTVAFATSNMWADIVLYPIHDRYWRKTLRRCMRLSRSRPLNICLDGRCPRWRCERAARPMVPKREWKAMADLLHATASRWRGLCLNKIWPPSELFEGSRPLPLLTTLELTRCEFNSTDKTRVSAMSFFTDCPALLDVRVVDVAIFPSDLPWAQFSVLDLDVRYEHDLDACVEHLQACHNLQSLNLATRSGSVELPHLHLPALRCIQLHGSAVNLLDTLTAPRLQDISIMSCRSMGKLLAFADRNHGIARGISSLMLSFEVEPESEDDHEPESGDDHEHWVKLCTAYESLSRLSIHNLLDDHDIFLSMARSLTSHPNLLPNLVYLNFCDAVVTSREGMDALIDLHDRLTSNRCTDAATFEMVVAYAGRPVHEKGIIVAGLMSHAERESRPGRFQWPTNDSDPEDESEPDEEPEPEEDFEDDMYSEDGSDPQDSDDEDMDEYYM